jgi:hypothetical protein
MGSDSEISPIVKVDETNSKEKAHPMRLKLHGLILTLILKDREKPEGCFAEDCKKPASMGSFTFRAVHFLKSIFPASPRRGWPFIFSEWIRPDLVAGFMRFFITTSTYAYFTKRNPCFRKTECSKAGVKSVTPFSYDDPFGSSFFAYACSSLLFYAYVHWAYLLTSFYHFSFKTCFRIFMDFFVNKRNMPATIFQPTIHGT